MAVKPLRDFNPNVVIGFGSYAAFPAVFAAICFRYPVMIHEQNVFPGRANTLLSKFVKKIAISFKQSKKYFPERKTVLTGCPSRFLKHSFDRKQLLKSFGLVEGKYTILIFGGSQGSQSINRVFVEAMELIKEKAVWQVIHLCGKNDFAKLKTRYDSLGIQFALFEFLNKMDWAYQLADLVISRAGASTITEIAIFEKPAILIPYPYAGGHQRDNANILSGMKDIRVIEEKNLAGDVLLKNIVELREGLQNQENGKNNFKDIYFLNSAERIAHEVISLAHAN